MGTSEYVKGGIGPDWFDLMASLRSVEEYHQVACTISVTVVPGYQAQLNVAVSAIPSATPPATAIPLDDRRWAVSGPVAARGIQAVTSRIYGMILELDQLLGTERWAQLQLGGEAPL